MLKIRQEQVEAMADQQLREFALSLLYAIKAEPVYGVQGAPDAQVMAMTMAAVKRAHAYGFRQRRAIGCYVLMSFAVAPNFDAHPMVRAILTDKRLAADQRPFELTRSLPGVVWEECAARNDPQTWMQDPHNG